MKLNDAVRAALEPLILKNFLPQTRDGQVDIRFIIHDGRLSRVRRLHGEDEVQFEKKSEKMDYLG